MCNNVKANLLDRMPVVHINWREQTAETDKQDCKLENKRWFSGRGSAVHLWPASVIAQSVEYGEIVASASDGDEEAASGSAIVPLLQCSQAATSVLVFQQAPL